MSVAFLSFDSAAFQESDHPRDKDGKFSTGGSGGGGSVVHKIEPTPGVKTALAKAGFTKKEGPGETTFTHPSGAKVVIHKATGETASSKWTSHKPGFEPVKGAKGAALAELLRVAVEKSKQKKKSTKQEWEAFQEQAFPKSTAEKTAKSQASSGGVVAAATVYESLTDKGYKHAENPDGYSSTFEKSDGSKVWYNHNSDDWIAKTPGHLTKSGVGANNLEALLSGKPTVFEAGKQPWQNYNGTFPGEKDPHAEAKETAKKVEAHYAKFKAAAPAPSEPEELAISHYGGSGYSSLNDSLRHNPEFAEGNEKVKHLDSFLAKSAIPEDTTVYRGVSGDYAKILKSILIEGTKFVDRGFISTSSNPKVGENWGSGLTMKINVKAGSKGAAIGQWSGHHSEHEILFPRNSALVVKSYDPKTGHVELDLDQGHL